MTTFALWQKGQNGGRFSLLCNRDSNPDLTADEKRTKLCEPIKLAEGDERLSIDVLRRLYPIDRTSAPDAKPQERAA